MLLQVAMRSKQSHCCRPLKKGARLTVDGAAHEVIGGRVANLEMDLRIEWLKVNQIGLTKDSSLVRRLLSLRKEGDEKKNKKWS